LPISKPIPSVILLWRYSERSSQEVAAIVQAIRILMLSAFTLAGYFFFRSTGWPPWLGPFAGLGVGMAIIYLETRFEGRSGREILVAVLGLILGLVVALLIDWVVLQIPAVAGYPYGQYVIIALALILGYLGAAVSMRKCGDIRFSLGPPAIGPATTKILDTSVIIDGRIADISESYFIEGKLVIPKFVLDELQQIADSPDPLKRTRGRRGLEILRRMQLRKDLEVVVEDHDPGGSEEVDAKLISLARERNAKIVTNDFNLNKVAELHGIKVLNVNVLAIALRPVVLPGEEMNVRIVKRGREADQGVGYLDDGTMVVVEGGNSHQSRTVDVIITSVLQTTVGRMIFAKIK